MKPRYIPPTLFTSFALIALSVALPALAQDPPPPYDVPTVSFVRAGLYRIDLDIHGGASGAPAGFAVQWMKKSDYDLSGWPADEYDPKVDYCDFTGDPTLNLDSRSSTFKLSGDGLIKVEMGDLFDETGCYATYADGLTPGTEYVFRVHAEGDANGGESAFSQNEFASTLDGAECTQGFWKTHPEVWPAGCTPMLLGTVAYTQAELLQIYNMSAGSDPNCPGNGLLSLAHQLITTKLNLCNGSDPIPIQQTVNDADALIDGLVIPPIGSGCLASSQTSDLTETLDDYNNGIIPGVVDCPTKTRASTWGGLKARYR